MSTSIPLTSPAFGMEVELFLRPKQTAAVHRQIKVVGWDSTHHDRNRVRGGLYYLVQAILAEDGIASTTELDDKYLQWTITGDGTLTGGEQNGFWGVELVSPILKTKENWKQELVVLFEALLQHFDIKVDMRYGTHVHVSPGDRPWAYKELAAILKAVAVYNESIIDMLPPERKDNGFAVSNFSHKSVPAALRNAYLSALATGDYQHVFAILDSMSSSAQFAGFYETRWFMFNMTNVAKSSGTIEFRSAPASPDAMTAKHWAVWVMSFVVSAISTDDWNALRAGSVADLRQFILAGEMLLPNISQGLVDLSRLRRIGGSSPFTAADKEKMEEVKRRKEKS